MRPASRADLPSVLALLVDDDLGRSREGGAEDAAYADAFAAIERDPNNALYVIDMAGEIAGYAQLTVIPGLSRRGAARAQIESVRISSSRRGQGLGRWFFAQLIGAAQARGCTIVQLTSDKRRKGALRFYESLGFEASHEGFKLTLPSGT
jgi:ribosomal protein S18 acetylase RimI-like enzyme